MSGAIILVVIAIIIIIAVTATVGIIHYIITPGTNFTIMNGDNITIKELSSGLWWSNMSGYVGLSTSPDVYTVASQGYDAFVLTSSQQSLADVETSLKYGSTGTALFFSLEIDPQTQLTTSKSYITLAPFGPSNYIYFDNRLAKTNGTATSSNNYYQLFKQT